MAQQLEFHFEPRSITPEAALPRIFQNNAGSKWIEGVPASLLDLIRPGLVAVDVETEPLVWFEKKNRRKLTFRDHPRLAQPQLIGIYDGDTCVILTPGYFHLFRELVLCGNFRLLFYNASFDYPVLKRWGLLE